jgi:glyoxylase-like metal-dependent hydrolase (beta-lactamase superfamily II)
MKARRVTDLASVVRADNPGVMTLDGTNTWILRAPDSERSVVVDPGPDDLAHLAEVEADARHVELVLFTHHHADHTDSFETARTWAPVRAISAAWCAGAAPLGDGELISVAGLTLEVVQLPGHTADSVGFLVREDASLITGDTVLGFGTSVVAHPDGALGPYLRSLERIRVLAEMGDAQRLLPGHGSEVTDPRPLIDYYIAHRHERLAQVRAAVEAGAATPRAVVERIYVDVDEALWPAAELTVQAQLAYLARFGP